MIGPTGDNHRGRQAHRRHGARSGIILTSARHFNKTPGVAVGTIPRVR